jgi:hypothetical protein
MEATEKCVYLGERGGWERTAVTVDGARYVVLMKQALDFNARPVGYRVTLMSQHIHPSQDAALDAALRAITKLGLGYEERVF